MELVKFDHRIETTRSKGNPLDPFAILGYINAGLSVLSHGLSVATQALSLVLPFL